MLNNHPPSKVALWLPYQAVEFYTQKLGFEVKSDMQFGNNLRWIEVSPRESKHNKSSRTKR